LSHTISLATFSKCFVVVGTGLEEWKQLGEVLSERFTHMKAITFYLADERIVGVLTAFRNFEVK